MTMTAFKKCGSRAFALVCFFLLLTSFGYAAQLNIVGPVGSGAFGTMVTVLPNGNFVVTDPGFDASGPISNVGAVYLYGASGGLISTLTGSLANDAVGTSVIVLANGNFVVRSTSWNGLRGAVTWGSATSGVSGAVSASNSLVGGTARDQVGNNVTALSNGNYVVSTISWDASPLVTNVGAATWGNGSSGTVGLVSVGNSLVGGTANDNIGQAVTALSNGNYVVRSFVWDAPSPLVADVGAVTWGNGSSGTVGLVSVGNSLVGASASDSVGNFGVTALSNGSYVVRSANWDTPVGPVNDVGAATWGNGSGGTVGLVSASNSLVGVTAGDFFGSSGITALSNGNYVVHSPNWDNPSPLVLDVGAATWGNGNGGTVGLVSASNSLVGAGASDSVGSSGVTVLSNGNYVVRSANWDAPSPLVADVGAATWGNGSGGTVGLVSASNSLVGASATDLVGNGVTALSNGNYVVGSANWDNPLGPVTNVGAATWGNGSGGTVGLVSASNSLVGGRASDNVSTSGITALSNGNYVVRSTNWDNAIGPVVDVGAATWGNGVSGTVGLVSASNSLVGVTASDRVGNFGTTARHRPKQWQLCGVQCKLG